MNQAVVLLSGGLDSATVLAYAIDKGYECHTLSFDYGQRTKVELEAASRLSQQMGAITHRVVTMSMDTIGGSSLTDTSIDIPVGGLVEGEVPNTYVPARNTIFLSYGLALAEVLKAQNIFIGVNQVDFSGYPDCRADYIKSFEVMANLATQAGREGNKTSIKTPLIDLSKAEIIQLGTSLGVNYSQTISCYQADDKGRACGVCDSCRLRKQGFQDAEVSDPTSYIY